MYVAPTHICIEKNSFSYSLPKFLEESMNKYQRLKWKDEIVTRDNGG